MIKKQSIKLTILITLGILLSSCDSSLAQSPATDTVADTPQPTVTIAYTTTSTRTAMPTATMTVTPTQGYVYVESYEVLAGGYRFQVPESDGGWSDLEVTTANTTSTFVSDLNGEMRVQITSGAAPYKTSIDQEIVEMGKLVANYDLVEIDPDSFEVDGHAARRGIFKLDKGESEQFIWELFLIDAGENRIVGLGFYLYGTLNDADWESEMAPFRDAFLDSFQVFDPVM